MTFDRPTDPAQNPPPADDLEQADAADSARTDVADAADAADAPPPPPPPSAPSEPVAVEPEPEPMAAEPEPEPMAAEPEPVQPAPVAEPVVEPVVEPEPVPEPEPEPAYAAEPEPVPVPATEPVAVAPPPPVQPAPSQVNVAAAPVAAAPVRSGPGPLYWARRILSLLFAVLFVLIGVRIFLLLFVADPSNNIVDFVYSVTEPFVAPFRGMFQFDAVVAGERTLDVAALAALIGWLLIYVLIMAILRLGDRRRA